MTDHNFLLWCFFPVLVFWALTWPWHVDASANETRSSVAAAADFGFRKPSIFHAVLSVTDSP